MDRIKINGVWYVPEDTSKKVEDISILASERVENDSIHYEGIFWEDDQILLDSTILKGGGDNMISIKYFNKHTKVQDYWDNNIWLLEVYDEKEESIKILKEDETFRDPYYYNILINFLDLLIEKKFLK